jgi:hypothetical protein
MIVTYLSDEEDIISGIFLVRKQYFNEVEDESAVAIEELLLKNEI